MSSQKGIEPELGTQLKVLLRDDSLLRMSQLELLPVARLCWPFLS